MLGVILIASLGFAVSRIVAADHAVTGAAADAARRASLARNPGQARSQARAAVEETIARSHLYCRRTTVRVDTDGFATPVGRPSTVTVTVSCSVELADLTPIPGLPGTLTRTSTFTSPLDQYRERTPGQGRSGVRP